MKNTWIKNCYKDFRLFQYYNMNIEIIDNNLFCLCFKDNYFIVFDKENKVFYINKHLYNNSKYFNSKTLFEKVKRFLKTYLWKTIKSKIDFMIFINEYKNFNNIDIKAIDTLYYNIYENTILFNN